MRQLEFAAEIDRLLSPKAASAPGTVHAPKKLGGGVAGVTGAGGGGGEEGGGGGGEEGEAVEEDGA